MKRIISLVFFVGFVFAAEVIESTTSVEPVTLVTEHTLSPVYEPIDVSFIHSYGLENILSILEERFFKMQKIKEHRSEHPPEYITTSDTHIPELVSDPVLAKLEEELNAVQEKYISVAEAFIAKIRSLKLEEIQKLGKLLRSLRQKAKEKELLKALFLEKVEPREYDYLFGARECPLACMILKAFDQIALLRKAYCGLNIFPEDVEDVFPIFDLFGETVPEFIEMLSITIDAKITPFENIVTILRHPHVGSDVKIVNEPAIPHLDAMIKTYQETEATDSRKRPYTPADFMLPFLNIADFFTTRAAIINFEDVEKAEKLMASDSYKQMVESRDTSLRNLLQIQQKIDSKEVTLTPQEFLEVIAARLALEELNKGFQLMQSLPMVMNYEENKRNMAANKMLARRHYEMANTFLRAMSGIDDETVVKLEGLFNDITRGCSQKEWYRQLFGIDPPLTRKRGFVVKHDQQQNHADQHIWDIFLNHRPKMLWGSVVRNINCWNQTVKEFGCLPFSVEITPYNYRKIAMGMSLLTSIYGIAQMVMAGVNHVSIPTELFNEILPIVNLLQQIAPSILGKFIFHIEASKTCVENIEYIFSNRSVENVALLGLEKFSQEKVERVTNAWRKAASHLKVGKIIMKPASEADVQNSRYILKQDAALASTKASIEIIVDGASLSGEAALALVEAEPELLKRDTQFSAALKFMNLSSFSIDCQVAILGAVTCNEKLQDISLCNLGIADSDEVVAAAIVDMVRNGGVKKLDIGNNKFGLRFMQRLDSLAKDSAIEVLRLNGNPITDEGARRLGAMMRKNPAFQAVGVAECGLSEKGSEYIVDACLDQKSGIKMINFTGNQFSDELVKKLLSNGFVSMKNPALPNFDLAFAHISRSSR